MPLGRHASTRVRALPYPAASETPDGEGITEEVEDTGIKDEEPGR
jgi:hypothetical protein